MSEHMPADYAALYAALREAFPDVPAPRGLREGDASPYGVNLALRQEAWGNRNWCWEPDPRLPESGPECRFAPCRFGGRFVERYYSIGD
jgi:hypothetical protein